MPTAKESRQFSAVAFVLDKSGSMQEEGKIEQAKAAVLGLASIYDNPPSGVLRLARFRELPCTIVFVHGIFSDAGAWSSFLAPSWAGRTTQIVNAQTTQASDLNAVDCYAVTLPSADNQTFEEQGRDLGRILDLIHDKTGKPILLVCHSMGGLAARAYLAYVNPSGKNIAGLLTVGTPHLGSVLGYLAKGSSGGYDKSSVFTVNKLDQVADALRKAYWLTKMKIDLDAKAVRYLQPPDETSRNELWRLAEDRVFPKHMIYGEIVSEWNWQTGVFEPVGAQALKDLIDTLGGELERYVNQHCRDPNAERCSLDMLKISDGVVPLESQKLSNVLPRQQPRWLIKRKTNRFHTDETSDFLVLDEVISAMLEKLGAVKGGDFDKVALVTFDRTAQALMDIGSGEGRERLKTALNGVRAGGGTDVGAGLNLALGMAGRHATETFEFVLLSDGQDHGSQLDAAVAGCKSKQIPVSAVALGRDADRPRLRQIAQETGGAYAEADSLNLLHVFTSLWAKGRRLKTILNASWVIAQGETKEYIVNLFYEPVHGIATAVQAGKTVVSATGTLVQQAGTTAVAPAGTLIMTLSWPGSRLGLSLETADGKSLANQVVVRESGKTFILAQATGLPSGEYRIKVTGEDVSGPVEPFTLTVYSAQESGLFMPPLASEYRIGENVQVPVAVNCADKSALKVRLTPPAGPATEYGFGSDTFGDKSGFPVFQTSATDAIGIYHADFYEGPRKLSSLSFRVGTVEEIAASLAGAGSRLDAIAHAARQSCARTGSPKDFNLYCAARLLRNFVQAFAEADGPLMQFSRVSAGEMRKEEGGRCVLRALTALLDDSDFTDISVAEAGITIASTRGGKLGVQLPSRPPKGGLLLEETPQAVSFGIPIGRDGNKLIVFSVAAEAGKFIRRFHLGARSLQATDWQVVDQALLRQSARLVPRVLAAFESERAQKGIGFDPVRPFVAALSQNNLPYFAVSIVDAAGRPYFTDSRSSLEPAGAIRRPSNVEQVVVPILKVNQRIGSVVAQVDMTAEARRQQHSSGIGRQP